MKKYITICLIVVLLLGLVYYLNFYTSFHLNFNHKVSTDITTNGKDIIFNNKSFTIKGLDLASSIPNHDETDYAISKSTYLRWFKEIKKMHINTIRVYTILNKEFYEAFYEYNKDNKDPLYLIQGMDVGDYEENSSVDYFADSLRAKLITDVKVMVDVIHGQRIINYNTNYSSGSYFNDVSKWTIAYIIGTEWNDVTVAYTNNMHPKDTKYLGKYLHTSKKATPFERILTEVGDKLISYESSVYNEQRLVGFGNYPLTDPFTYDTATTDLFNKFASVDTANIVATKKVKSGLFAAFQAYSGYPDYYSYSTTKYADSYAEYLKRLNDHYTIPVVISEFGYSTARGQTIANQTTNYQTSALTETEQANLTIKALKTMKSVGINNFILYEWQDEWNKNVWNTMYAKDITTSQYWNDVETSTSNFGLLTFDPGKKKTKVTVDGKTKDWSAKNTIVKTNNLTIASQYDNKYIYFLVTKKNLAFASDTIYIPIDLTSKSGSKTVANENVKFNRNVDFLIKINGSTNSKVTVQEYYDTLKAIYGKKITGHEPFEKDNMPSKNSNVFDDLDLITSTQDIIRNNAAYTIENKSSLVNVGSLTYGNADPNNINYNSQADFYSEGDNIEIRIPWALLNFYDPSVMKIHDDYYQKYGVEAYSINKMYLGVGEAGSTIKLSPMKLVGWSKFSTYHERLKKSYYLLQEYLAGGE